MIRLPHNQIQIRELSKARLKCCFGEDGVRWSVSVPCGNAARCIEFVCRELEGRKETDIR